MPFEAGTDRRGKTIQLCEVQLSDLQAALAAPVRRRFGVVPPPPDAKLGKNQKLLLRLLRRLFAKHPEGVERATLCSHFIMELARNREQEGKDALEPKAATAAFRQTLARVRDYVVEDGDTLFPVLEE